MVNRFVLLSALVSLAASPLLRCQVPAETGAAQVQQGASSDCTNSMLEPGEDCLPTQQQYPGTTGAGGSGASNGMPIPRSLGYVTPEMGNPYNYSMAESQRWQKQPLPPDLPTEFQKFVAETTGQFLPIYGADLFRRVPSTYAPNDMAPVPPDYVIGPEDELRVRVWGQVNFSGPSSITRACGSPKPGIGRPQ